MASQGAVLRQVSTRYLEVSRFGVGMSEAKDNKRRLYSESTNRDAEYIFSTTVVISAREEADIGRLAASDQWALTEAEDDQRVWTDDYSNVLGAVWRRLKKGEE